MWFETTSKVDQLKNRSANVLSVFTNTITDLELINSEIELEAEARLIAEEELLAAAEIERLRYVDIQQQAGNNSKIINKIRQFLND